jgi:hypothetical protein
MKYLVLRNSSDETLLGILKLRLLIMHKAVDIPIKP